MAGNYNGGDRMKTKEAEKERIIMEANQAKERLAQVAEKLDSLGYSRKAKSCMTIVYRIEEWQNRG